jgi:small-conductance mechanosensitive channel
MVSSRFVPTRTAGRVSRRLGRRLRRGPADDAGADELGRRVRRSPTDDSVADDAAAARAGSPLQDARPGDPVFAADGAEQGAIDGVAAQAESALVDERRSQRVQALGAILRSAASVTIFAIAGFIILGDLGINLAPLLASAGVVGVAIGFGAQSLVKDYLSGIFMLVEDQYGVGDVITIGDATGTVENVTLRVTRMRDVNGIVWHIRNGTIDTVGNESQGWARAVIDFPVPFAADLATIRDVLAQTGEGMWNDPAWRAVMLEAPEVWGAQEISSSEVTMRIVVKTAPLRQWEVEREMRAQVKRALKEAGLMPSPAEKPTMAVTLTRDE